MFTTKFARILVSIAAVSLILALTACGGGGSAHSNFQNPGPQITSQPVGPEINSGGNATLTVAASGSGTVSYQWYQGPTGTTTTAISGATSSSYTTPALTATTSYWVQVSDSAGTANSNTAVVLIAGPRQVQALIFSLVTQPPPATFIANVLQNISGVSIGLPWSQIETSQGIYDFTAFDISLQPYINAHRKVNLIVWPATEGGNNDPYTPTQGSTPLYVFSTTWANDPSVNAPNPLDMAVCGSYKGDAGNPFSSAVASGSGGAWNITTSADLSGLPVSYEAPFKVAYQNFIKQVISHYNGNTVTPINYIRFGFSQGGENSPECNQYWPGYNKAVYLSYVQTMTDFIHSQNPSMTILADLHAVGPPGSVDYGYADSEAAYAEPDQFGFGTNGLQQSDITNFGLNLPCDSDWCNLFTPLGGFSYKPTLSLQTLQWSDPSGQDSSNPTGSLATLELFAKDHGANNLELYLADVGIAFDSANYQSYPHAYATINPGTYNASYVTAIQDFLTH
jgi:Ig-like domain CHU_C associated